MAEVKSTNILIGITGSVASIKLQALIEKLKVSCQRCGTDGRSKFSHLHIKVIQTQSSKHFVCKEEIENLDDTFGEPIVEFLDDQDEWSQWTKMTDPVLHIELRKWADVMVIAPLDANTMAKMANGLCDNLLTCVIRAWDMSKSLIYCPAMNVHMYEHPITAEHLSKLDSFGYLRVDSIEKRLACGDFGLGGMAAVDTIAEKVIECLERVRIKSS